MSEAECKDDGDEGDSPDEKVFDIDHEKRFEYFSAFLVEFDNKGKQIEYDGCNFDGEITDIFRIIW